jgi:agmatinase
MSTHYREGRITVIGIPTDVNSSFLPGAALAPNHIREAMRSPSTNLWTENEVDLGAHPGWKDRGDLDLDDGAIGESIERGISGLVSTGDRVVALGGDHAITYPILKATAPRHERLTILHLDAHADLYDEFEGNRESHACPFARIMEDGLATRVVQIGIRTMNSHQRQQAERFGIEVHGARGVPAIAGLKLEPPLYLSLDLDALDPSCAPGVAHPEPGGLTTREVISIIQDLPWPLVGADIVELNPHRDFNGLTAMVAAKLLKEILANMIAADSTKTNRPRRQP